MPEAAITPSHLALEQEGLEFLRKNKFRKARDIFKALHKVQPSRALPLLIEANLGLAQEMLSKGLVSEANQVLAYLKTIAPTSYDFARIPAAENARDTWCAMVPLAAQRLANSNQLESSIRAADEMILGAESPDHPGHPDAKAILTALEIGYGQSNFARTTELLRTVPRSSPFSHWVIFFKGMTALESGDHARAADCFRRVPQSSLLHSSILALLAICGDPSAAPPSPRAVHALCAWAGYPKLAEPLLQAEPLWCKKRQSKAFTVLTKEIPDLICWGARDFKADLARFLTTEFVRTHSEDNDYGDTLIEYISVKSRTVARSVIDQAFFAINFAEYSSCAHTHLRGAVAKLGEMASNAPITPAMLSRVFTNLAEAYITAAKKDPDDPCSPPNAKRALEHAIKHDPDNLRAWLMQSDLLSMGRDTSAYHRFLDDLTKRFPSHKEVLIRNGDCCTARKSYTKALRNFESAAKLDSVDPRVTTGILRARLGIAEESNKKRKSADWELLESLATTDKSDGEFSLWRLRVRRIVWEAKNSAPEANIVALAAATLPVAPSAFMLKTACRFALLDSRKCFKPSTLEKMFPSGPAPESLSDFLAIIDEADAFAESTCFSAFAKLASDLFTEYEHLLLQFVAERKDVTTLLLKILSCARPCLILASPVIRAWLLREPADPLLRFLRANYRFSWAERPLKDDRIALAEQLRDSHDPATTRIAALIAKDVSRASAERYGGIPRGASPKFDLDYDPHSPSGYAEDLEDDDDGGDFGAIGPELGNMSPGKLMEILAKAFSDPGMPGPVNPFNPLPKPRPKPQPKPRATPTGPVPRQMSFDEAIFPPSQPSPPPQP